ncbi:hypothetical protein EGW08_022593 [Elysia chlorotica]|uniref:C-type lectin domain-containing protein n=1 Tax=Elysia chlorotica TaxID=188477 RepID=A0A3S1AVT9_ELYCH|nr:hypothetical protein EGW08_022593 [Elysia chlorotica]
MDNCTSLAVFATRSRSTSRSKSKAISMFIVCIFFRLTASECPFEWDFSKVSRTCYTLFTNKKNWDDARAHCFRLGGDLLKITSAADNSAFYGGPAERDGARLIWIGLHNNGSGFRWLDDNTNPTYTAWVNSYPKLEGRACATWNERDNFFWTDKPCGTLAEFMCEKFADPEKCKDSSDHAGIRCPAKCQEQCKPRTDLPTCDARTGSCSLGCYAGFGGDTCDAPCTNRTYGEGCFDTCSPFCGGNTSCSAVTGDCSSGDCIPGYNGSKCDNECPNGTYGLGCSQNCSRHCGGPDQLCEKALGVCLDGCTTGYIGDNCLQKLVLDDDGIGAGVIFGMLFLIMAVIATILLLGMKKYPGDDVQAEESKPPADTNQKEPSKVSSKGPASHTSGGSKSKGSQSGGASSGAERSGGSGGGQDE